MGTSGLYGEELDDDFVVVTITQNHGTIIVLVVVLSPIDEDEESRNQGEFNGDVSSILKKDKSSRTMRPVESKDIERVFTYNGH